MFPFFSDQDFTQFLIRFLEGVGYVLYSLRMLNAETWKVTSCVNF